jgi:hypothetical protein
MPHAAATKAAVAMHTTISGSPYMPQLYESPDQEALHLKAMNSLAIETGHELAVVRQVYEAELARLQAGAHVREFVLLLSSRRARESLRKPAKAVPSQSAIA